MTTHYDERYEAPEVRQRPIEERKPAEKPVERVSGGLWPAAIALAIVGALLWLAGARYTLLGWVSGLNWFLAWLGLPARVPTPAGWYILLLIPLGLLYSAVEVRRPWKRKSKNEEKTVLYWAIWIALVATDIGTTFFGVLVSVTASSWPIVREIAALWPVAFVWALVLTFVPEWFVGGARKLIKG